MMTSNVNFDCIVIQWLSVWKRERKRTWKRERKRKKLTNIQFVISSSGKLYHSKFKSLDLWGVVYTTGHRNSIDLLEEREKNWNSLWRPNISLVRNVLMCKNKTKIKQFSWLIVSRNEQTTKKGEWMIKQRSKCACKHQVNLEYNKLKKKFE